MKIAYLICGTYNSGGMERVLCNKANWFVANGYDVSIITTDQNDKSPFFDFSPKIKMYDLSINYTDNLNCNFIKKTIRYLHKTRLHRIRLAQYLHKEQFDIVISMYGNETPFLPQIKDGSAKLFEIHFSRYIRTEMEQTVKRGVLYRIVARYRQNREIGAINNYDAFVVLTEEDKAQWMEANIKKEIRVIPNSVSKITTGSSENGIGKQVLAVGRLDPIKGFDMLFKAWVLVSRKHPDWHLKLYGSGDQYDHLQSLIHSLSITHSVDILLPTSDIATVYDQSDIYVLSSRCEGLPMVLLEAMGCGVPCVSFACKCGPRDVISDGVDGFLVEQNNIEQMAERICALIENEDLRRQMGQKAVEKVATKFSIEAVMLQWTKLFNKITK